MIAAIVEARDRWLAVTPAERAELGPNAIATCAQALDVLTGRLADLGYPLVHPLDPCPDLDDDLAQFVDAGIVVPPALAAVWRDIGSISLVDLDRYRHVAFWDAVADRWRASGAEQRPTPNPCCDGVVIDGPSQDGWLDFILDTLESAAEDDRPPAIEIAPDDLHKDNISGSGPYEIVLPGAGEDPWLAALDSGFRWSTTRPLSAPPGAPDLVSYLRTAVLECGGFPGLHGHPAFTAIVGELTAGLPVF